MFESGTLSELNKLENEDHKESIILYFPHYNVSLPSLHHNNAVLYNSLQKSCPTQCYSQIS